MQWIETDYLENMKILALNLKDRMKSTGWICFKGDDITATTLFPIFNEFFHFHGFVIWNKMKIGLGHYIRKQHEIISCYRVSSKEKSYFLHRPKMKKGKKKDGFHGSSKGLSFPSVISVLPLGDGILGNTEKDHLCKTPQELWRWFVRWLCPNQGIVFDPFAGTGSIAKACNGLLDLKGEKIQISYYGIEIDEKCWNKWNPGWNVKHETTGYTLAWLRGVLKEN